LAVRVQFWSLWIAVFVNLNLIFTVKYRVAVNIKYRIAVFGYDGHHFFSPVNALIVRNHTLQFGLGHHNAFEQRFPGIFGFFKLRRIAFFFYYPMTVEITVIKAVAAQIAISRSILYRRRVYGYTRGVVFNIEYNFVGEDTLVNMIYSQQSDF